MKTATIVANLLLLSSLSFALGMQNSSPTPTPTPTPATGEARWHPRKLRVSSGVLEGLALYKVPPKYPAKAKKKHIQGDVILQATINKQGEVAQLNVVEGDPILAEAAMDAVKQWKYKPYVLNGEPVEVETKFKISFYM